jgi:nicotinamide riboside transporter PnuC
MTELLGSIATVLAVGGCILNNRRRRVCFIAWMVSNCICVWLHFDAGLWSLMVRDVIFSILAVEGWFLWNKRK